MQAYIIMDSYGLQRVRGPPKFCCVALWRDKFRINDVEQIRQYVYPYGSKSSSAQVAGRQAM